MNKQGQHTSRPTGISAFVRCQNEEEYIVASLLSCYRFFDEIIVVLNNSTDATPDLVNGLTENYPKIKVFFYDKVCARVGLGYVESVEAQPDASLAKYYNWCLEQTTYSHVCKWDGDMVGLPPLEQITENLSSIDVVSFDGFDPLGQVTTSCEARLFRYDPNRTRYIDWDLYEILEHNYERIRTIEAKCYVHMKLLKRAWVGKDWHNPNDDATRPFASKASVLDLPKNKKLSPAIKRIARYLHAVFTKR